jgi:outer membrane autotransporter protein
MTADAISPHRQGTNVSPSKVRGFQFMFRKRLVATAAAAPLLLFAGQALAEITITDTKTAPVATSTGGDAIRITNTGKIKPTSTPAGGSLIVDSNHNVVNEGEIATREIDDTAGILVLGGVTADITNKGLITIDDDYTAKDTNNDGIPEGRFAEGTGRYGIRVTGPGTYTGVLLNDVSSVITVEGNNSAGISVESAFVGTFSNRGAINVTGDNNFGVRIASGAPVTGDVRIRGSVNALGENSVGVALDGDVTGQVLLQGAIVVRGYRFASRPTTAEGLALLITDPNNILQGGPAVRIAGNVTGGILLDIPPADLSSTNDDEDGDGITDSTEGSSAIIVQGRAPALLVGSDTANITIGVVGAGDLAYGLVIRGSIASSGVLDDVSSTGVQIGGDGGFATTLTGGVRIEGIITTRAYNAEAQGLHLKSGAAADVIWNAGTIFSIYSATSAPLAQEDAFDIRGLRIDAGATVSTVHNAGVISASVTGERSNAIAIQDLSGTVDLVENTGQISALVSPDDDAADTDDADTDASDELVVGRGIAIDLRLASGATIVRQVGINDGDDDGDPATIDTDTDGDGVDDADEPFIIGEILFGGGADLLDLQNGFFSGAVSFGDGADTFRIDGGTQVRSNITDSDGQLAIELTNGELTLTGTAVIDATSLTVGADSSLIITADPLAGTNTRLDVATATLASGAQIGLELNGLIDGPERYIVIRTDLPAGLTAGTLDQSLLGNSPFLMIAEAGVDAAAGEVFLDVRRRTVAEMALVGNEALALDAVYTALNCSVSAATPDCDEGMRNAFLGATTRQEFLDLYEQMLPDQGEGVFAAVDSMTRAISRLTATKPDPRERYGPDSFWLQEINTVVLRDAGVGLGSETKAFGFVGGYESMGSDGGALGATLAFMSAQEKDDVAQIGEETTVNLMEAGVYWRRSVGGWLFSARGSAGYAWFDGDRVFISPSDGLIRQADSGWNGFTGLGNVTAAYEAGMGRLYIRPRVSLDYLYLSEGSRQESGGQDAFNLFLDERTSNRLSGTAELAFGATFGRELWWRPEVRFGYRQHLAGEMGDTVFNFKNGQPVALPASASGDGTVVVGLSFKAGTPMSYVAMEAEYEASDGEDQYNLQLAGRMMF